MSSKVLQQLENQTILIVGDVMLDRYLTGSVTRISPEAPVPVVRYQATEDRLGGAANVALNIKALGGRPLLCSVLGDDLDGHLLAGLLPKQEMDNTGLIFSKERRTTVKTRIVGNNQQMLRIDNEDTYELTAQEQAAFLKNIQMIFEKNKVGAVILQDYNKGVLSAYIIEQVLGIAQAMNIPTAVDPKKANFYSYRGVTLFKPNLKEIRDSVPFDVQPDLASLQAASDYLRAQLGHQWTMITLSEKGIFLDENRDEISKIFPTVPRNVSDVSGAGDTVISIAALGLAAGLDPEMIAVLSNLAGGQVCEFPGVVPVNRTLLQQELDIHLL